MAKHDEHTSSLGAMAPYIIIGAIIGSVIGLIGGLFFDVLPFSISGGIAIGCGMGLAHRMTLTLSKYQYKIYK